MTKFLCQERTLDFSVVMAYSGFREELGPPQYPRDKTSQRVDIVEAGFIFAAIILFISFLAILPGIRGLQNRLFAFIRITVSIFLGVAIMLSAYGQEWESAEIYDVKTAYKTFFNREIIADVGVKIGLNSVNITLKSETDLTQHNGSVELGYPDEKIDYNERFHFYGGQGRIGFGRFSGRINREFRAAQWRGLPLPILWISEYFTLDGEDILWGRSYRLAGYYAWIMVWTAFPLWLLANILFFMVIRNGAYFLMLTGGSLLTANILYAGIRYGFQPMVIPFTAEKMLHFHKGATFYLCMVAGLIAFLSGIVILFMDFNYPLEIAAFFGVDPLQDFEDTFVYDERSEKAANGLSSSIAESKAVFKQRNKSRFDKPRRLPQQSRNGGPRGDGLYEVAEAPPEKDTDIAMGDIKKDEGGGYDNEAVEA